MLKFDNDLDKVLNRGKKMNKIRSAILFFIIVLTFPMIVGFSYIQEDPYLPFAQVMPAPVGGMESILKHLKYPDAAKKAGVAGKVYVLVYVNENGGVDQVKVVRGIGLGCDEAAIDAVKEAKFSPGKNDGASVKVKLSLAIIFKLS
jgi:protein TonB